MKSTTKAHLAVFGTNIFFAANYSLIKYISPALVKPYALNILRVAVSLLFFWSAWLLAKNKTGIKREDIARFFWCGLTGVAINQMLFVKGLTMTSTIHASLLMLSTPLLITFFAFWILKERITFTKSIGLIAGVGGATLLILAKENSIQNESYIWGDLLIIMNAISYTIYFILVKPLMQKYEPVAVIRWVFTFGLILIIPFGWNEFIEIEWQQFHLEQIAALSFIVLFGTLLAYLFNLYGIQHLGAGTTGAYIYTQPAFAAAIAILFLNERMTWEKAVAGALIFLGVFLVSYKRI